MPFFIVRSYRLVRAKDQLAAMRTKRKAFVQSTTARLLPDHIDGDLSEVDLHSAWEPKVLDYAYVQDKAPEGSERLFGNNPSTIIVDEVVPLPPPSFKRRLVNWFTQKAD